MNLNMADVRNCIDKATEIAEQYTRLVLAGDHMPRSLESLLWVCGQYLECRIDVQELIEPAPHKSVLGTYLKFDDRYVIIMQPGQNFCWRRFVLCKELFHVILDEPDCRITDIAKHLADIEAVFPVLDSTPGPTTVSEVLAEIAAMEFLFPYAFRKARLSDAPDYLAIAQEFKVPQAYVEAYMSPSFMSNLGAFAPADVRGGT